jgi:hypothetical protein
MIFFRNQPLALVFCLFISRTKQINKCPIMLAPLTLVQTTVAYVYKSERRGDGVAIAKRAGFMRGERAGPWEWYEPDRRQVAARILGLH